MAAHWSYEKKKLFQENWGGEIKKTLLLKILKFIYLFIYSLWNLPDHVIHPVTLPQTFQNFLKNFLFKDAFLFLMSFIP